MNTGKNCLYIADKDKCRCRREFVIPIFQIIIDIAVKSAQKLFLQLKIHKCTDTILVLNEKYSEIIIIDMCCFNSEC